MSETELRVADDDSQLDADDRLKPEFVDAVLDAVEAGDAEAARALVEPLRWSSRSTPPISPICSS